MVHPDREIIPNSFSSIAAGFLHISPSLAGKTYETLTGRQLSNAHAQIIQCRAGFEKLIDIRSVIPHKPHFQIDVVARYGDFMAWCKDIGAFDGRWDPIETSVRVTAGGDTAKEEVDRVLKIMIVSQTKLVRLVELGNALSDEGYEKLDSLHSAIGTNLETLQDTLRVKQLPSPLAP